MNFNVSKPWNKPSVWVALSLIVFAVGLRFWMLGLSAFKADTMEFYKLALRGQNIVEFWKNPPWGNQIPLSETLSLLLVHAGLPPSPFVVRLPFAIMGVLALIFVWNFARRWFGSSAALLTLLLAVFNPYQLYFSRTAYHYSGALCFSAALFLAFWSIKESLQKNESPRKRDLLFWFASAAVACHMHMSVWVVAGLQGLLLLLFGLRVDRQSGNRKRFFITFSIGTFLVSALMLRWVIRAVKEMIKVSGSGGHLGGSASAEFVRLLPAYFAGESLLAISLLFIVAALALYALFQPSEKRSRFRSLAWISILHIAIVMLYIGVAGGGVAKITYFSAIWPMFILFLGIGAALGIQSLTEKKQSLRFILWPLVVGGYIALTAMPAWAIIHLEGKPRPYWKIAQWMNTQLPAGTPVLVDRWYHPWNELAVHPSTNVFYTFTVPDEPIENFRKLNWRNTAEQFFENYPSAAFLEVSPGKYKDEFGVWEFPEQHFAQRATITNEAVKILQKYQVFPSAGYSKTNALVTRIFYNTTDDLLDAARAKGRDVLRLYGKGWGYIKPGWQRGDFSDYRTFGRAASIELYNLTDAPLSGTLQISAATAQKPKAVSAKGKSTVFTPGRIKTWNVSLILQSGKNTISLTSPIEDPLFVRDLRWTL